MRTLTLTSACALAGCLFVGSCSGEEKKEPPAVVLAPPAAVPAAPAAAAEKPVAPNEPASGSPDKPAAALADPDEACGQIILVAYRGAAHALPAIKRDKPAALARAEQLLQKLRDGGDFAALAASDSDAPSSAARAGVMGTYKRSEWPALHAALRDPLFALGVGQLAPAPIAADYGFAILRRCPVEKAHARHILVRYKGAKNADAGVKRTKAQAETRARELLALLIGGGDFAEIATRESDDASKTKGGDVGSHGRGIFALPFERALFALKPGEHSDIVESEFGYHIIQRLPDE